MTSQQQPPPKPEEKTSPTTITVELPNDKYGQAIADPEKRKEVFKYAGIGFRAEDEKQKQEQQQDIEVQSKFTDNYDNLKTLYKEDPWALGEIENIKQVIETKSSDNTTPVDFKPYRSAAKTFISSMTLNLRDLEKKIDEEVESKSTNKKIKTEKDDYLVNLFGKSYDHYQKVAPPSVATQSSNNTTPPKTNPPQEKRNLDTRKSFMENW